jgi:predicted AAA+ superfamily ATPase
MVLRRLSGVNTAPVLTLITQFGGGKTHTLAALYHLANAGSRGAELAEVAVSRQMFANILSLIARLRAPPAPA